MSDQTKETSGQPDLVVGDTNQESGGKDTVAYETYRKTVGEVKALKAKLSEFMAKETEREQATLAEQGKYKEALDSASKRVKDLETALDTKTKIFGRQVFTKEAKSVALQMGVRQEALDDIVKIGDWSGVEVDEEFNINQTQLKDAISKLSKEKPYFFQKSATSPKDVNPTNSSALVGNKKNPVDMSRDDLMKAIREAH